MRRLKRRLAEAEAKMLEGVSAGGDREGEEEEEGGDDDDSIYLLGSLRDLPAEDRKVRTVTAAEGKEGKDSVPSGIVEPETKEVGRCTHAFGSRENYLSDMSILNSNAFVYVHNKGKTLYMGGRPLQKLQSVFKMFFLSLRSCSLAHPRRLPGEVPPAAPSGQGG